MVVGHDPSSGEVQHYSYPTGGQSAFLPHQVMTASSDMPAVAAQQQTSAAAAGALSQQSVAAGVKPPASTVPSAATLGAGDSAASMIPPDTLLVQSHHNVPDPRLQGTLCGFVFCINGTSPVFVHFQLSTQRVRCLLP